MRRRIIGMHGRAKLGSGDDGRKLRMVEAGASPCKIRCRIGGMHREARYLRRWREVDPRRRLDLRRRWDPKSWRRAVLRRPPTSLQAWISLPRWSWLMRGLQMSSSCMSIFGGRAICGLLVEDTVHFVHVNTIHVHVLLHGRKGIIDYKANCKGTTKVTSPSAWQASSIVGTLRSSMACPRTFG